MCIPSLLNLLPTSHTILPLGCHRALDLSSQHHTANFHWLSNFTYGKVDVLMLFSDAFILSFSAVTETSSSYLTERKSNAFRGLPRRC